MWIVVEQLFMKVNVRIKLKHKSKGEKMNILEVNNTASWSTYGQTLKF